jgi:hypothetical protein
MGADMLKAFQAQIDNGLWDTLAMMADWLEDNEQPDLAQAYRWFVKERKMPICQNGIFQWWPRADGLNDQPYRIPNGILSDKGLIRISSPSARFTSMSEAYHAFAVEIVANKTDFPLFEIKTRNCRECNGTGRRQVLGAPYMPVEYETCPPCRGTGKIEYAEKKVST